MIAEIQKWCDPHWQELRKAIRDRGMGALISHDGKAAAKQFAREARIGNAGDAEGFDPLMRAWVGINARTLELGMPLFGECPLCWVQRHHDECKQDDWKPTPAEFVAGCTDSLLGLRKREGSRGRVMKGWLKFGKDEGGAPPRGEWHQVVSIRVTTACELSVKTDQRPGSDYPGYGARICPTCAAVKDEGSSL